MPVNNSEIAELFNKMGDLLEIEGANPFRVRAYRTAARTVGEHPGSLAEMVKEGGDLSELPGIGKDLAGKIAEIVNTGGLSQLAEVEERISPELTTLLRLPGLGPKRVQALHRALGIRNLADLRAAAMAGKVRDVHGLGGKTEQTILREIDLLAQRETRPTLASVEAAAESLVDALEKVEGVKEVTVAGSYRRRRETVGDLDILVTCRKDSPVMERFIGYEDAAEVVSRGGTRSTVVLRSGLQVDLRVVPQASYGAALHYFTGSKAHNVAVRTLGVKRGFKINEYGVFKGNRRVGGRTEAEVYELLGLRYIPPELREDRGEIEAARDGHLPDLVTPADIRGDLHAHTDATDGRDGLEAMARAARKRGYQYLAVTDHTRRLAMAHGLDSKRIAAQMEAIDRLNAKLSGFVLLKGAEVDILEDGSLDLPDELLKELDLTVCSVHSMFDLSGEKQTERILRAMENPYFTILGHPTGRLLGRREPCQLHMERIIAAARDRGCFLEVNAQPDRLDLTDIHCRAAMEHGVKVAVSTDAHSAAELDLMRFGVGQARRGWLEANDVINTRGLEEVRKLLREARG